MIKIKDLICAIDFEKVRTQIERYYKTEKIEQFGLLYQRLKMLDPTENINNMIVFIQVFQNIDNNVVCFPEYNELCSEQYDKELSFDVSGKDNLYEGCYSIVASKHNDFLGYFIEDETLQRFSKESILAHCLWEITFLGFNDTHEL